MDTIDRPCWGLALVLLQPKSIFKCAFCHVDTHCSSIEEAAAAALALTSDLVQAHSLYSARMNAPDAGDNSLAIDERMLLDVELLDWFFSKVSSVVIEHNYR